MDVQLLITLLFASANLLISSSASVVRQHSCDYERNSLCGWVSPSPPPDRAMSEIANASHPPTLGPHIDADPGRPDGHYFYFYTPSLRQPAQILRFPSHQYICQLSFSYFPVGAFDLEILRRNFPSESVFMNETYTSNTSYWRTASFNYSLSTTPADLGDLGFYIPEIEFGEAEEEDYDLFLGLDGVNLTFCLPCDFDNLSAPGNLILDAPQNVSVPLRASQSFILNASSPLCPNETLMFEMDSVQPNYLPSIFTLNSATGQLVVDGRGPGLDANGSIGTITVSVHVLGSNYTNTSEPFKQTAAIPFYQPPTITIDAPSNISVRANTSFSFQVSSMSALEVPLQYGTLVTTPPQLVNDLTLTSSSNRVLTIRGIISLSMLSQIIQMHITVPMVTVTVTDSFGGSLVHTTALLIQESAPIFNQSGYVFNITENEPVSSTSVGTFSVIDPNTDPLDSPRFDPRNSNFVIVSTSAMPCTVCEYIIFTTMSSFDYEQQTQYNVMVVVQDSLNRSLSSSATVTINVLPVNEYAPIFTKLSYVVLLSDVAPVGSFIAEPRASDPDRGPDGDISFSILSGNEDGFFEISAMFGTVTVAHSPLIPRNYNLTITATDHGTPPLFSRMNATVVVMVTASVPVDCNEQRYGPPVISSQGTQLQKKVGSNITLQCIYTANPTVRITKWRFIEFMNTTSTYIFMDDTSGHYSVGTYSLTVYNLTATDGGLYICNVTSQCGSDQTTYHVIIIDLPRPPSNVEVIDGPYERNVTLSWTLPTEGGGGISVLRPVDRFTVQVRETREGESYRDVVHVRSNVTTAVVEGLDPGREYEVRVVSSNEAGQTPSDIILINTTATVPQLLYLHARALQNLSLLIEWQLEYDGGFPVSNFLITVRVQLSRQRRNTPEFLHFEVSVDARRLVTGALEQGRIYTVNSEVTNQLGSSQRTGNVFVGQTDSVQCHFELDDDCPWQLDMDVSVVRAGQSGTLNTDASGLLGHYISAQLDPTPSSSFELVIATYSVAAYICNYTFSYQIHGGAELVLRDSSGSIIWSSRANNQATQQWIHVTLQRDNIHYLTDQLSDGLQFVLVRPTTSFSSETLRVFLDDVNVDFCLPCDFQQLQSSENFHLSYQNYSNIYLRMGQMLSIEAVVRGCPYNLPLNFSITRVVPNDLYSSFSVTNQDTTAPTITVSPISTDLAAPNTAGFLEVLVAVAYSDYQQDGEVISRVAEIQFKLLQTNENCSFTQTCDFEDGPCIWELGSGVNIRDSSSSPLSSLAGTSGAHLYGSYPSTATEPVVIATTTITDNHCATSFAYVTSLVEMQVTLEGLGTIWTSLTDSSEGLETPRWEREVIKIDLQGAMILENRTLTFVTDMTEAFGEAGMDGEGYFALDNITLHPCLDCNTPECSFSSCFPGHYFSLVEKGCISCPPGYYCSDWRQPPRPCLPGTYSNSSQRITQSSCKPCPPHTYANRPASTSCLTCPPGYNCSNPATNPVSTTCTNTSSHLCPAGFTCGDGDSQQPCPQGKYSFEGQRTCQTCPEGFSCANSSAPPVPIISTTSSSPPVPIISTTSSSPTNCPTETEPATTKTKKVPIVPVVAGSVGGGLALIIIIAGCCCVCWCYRRQRDKKIRRKRQRILASDRGSLDGSTLGRGSTFDSMGRRRLRTRGETSTLMSYMTDDSTINPFYDEASWMETEELTKPDAKGTLSFQNTDFNEKAGGSITYRNTGFEEEEEEEEEDGEGETELKESRWRPAPRHTTTTISSQF